MACGMVSPCSHAPRTLRNADVGACPADVPSAASVCTQPLQCSFTRHGCCDEETIQCACGPDQLFQGVGTESSSPLLPGNQCAFDDADCVACFPYGIFIGVIVTLVVAVCAVKVLQARYFAVDKSDNNPGGKRPARSRRQGLHIHADEVKRTVGMPTDIPPTPTSQPDGDRAIPAEAIFARAAGLFAGRRNRITLLSGPRPAVMSAPAVSGSSDAHDAAVPDGGSDGQDASSHDDSGDGARTSGSGSGGDSNDGSGNDADAGDGNDGDGSNDAGRGDENDGDDSNDADHADENDGDGSHDAGLSNDHDGGAGNGDDHGSGTNSSSNDDGDGGDNNNGNGNSEADPSGVGGAGGCGDGDSDSVDHHRGSAHDGAADCSGGAPATATNDDNPAVDSTTGSGSIDQPQSVSPGSPPHDVG